MSGGATPPPPVNNVVMVLVAACVVVVIVVDVCGYNGRPYSGVRGLIVVRVGADGGVCPVVACGVCVDI